MMRRPSDHLGATAVALVLGMVLLVQTAYCQDGNSGVKCTPCNPNPPPPPPPSPPPPPKTPSKQYCPPPPSSPSSPSNPSSPSSPYIYMTAPPGSLYPFDPNFSGANQNLVVRLPVLVGLTGLVAVVVVGLSF